MPVAEGHVFTPLAERFWAKVNKNGPLWNNTPCWLWTGTLTKGYGRVYIGAKTMCFAHRLSYIWARGPIPEELELDHLCRTLACVQPDHLELVTHQENMSRGISWAGRHGSAGARAAQTHCLRGHSLDNASIDIRKGGHTRRRCRLCAQIVRKAKREVQNAN